LCTEGEIGTYC